MKRRAIAALLACTMVIGTLAGCSSEPKNPGDSDTTVTETTAAETTAAAQTGPKVFNDYMTTDIDTLNSHIYTLSASSDVINCIVSIRPRTENHLSIFRSWQKVNQSR